MSNAIGLGAWKIDFNNCAVSPDAKKEINTLIPRSYFFNIKAITVTNKGKRPSPMKVMVIKTLLSTSEWIVFRATKLSVLVNRRLAPNKMLNSGMVNCKNLDPVFFALINWMFSACESMI